MAPRKSDTEIPAEAAPQRSRRPTMSLLSPRDLGRMNRARVLRALADRGPLSRSELARLAGVTRATIGSIVQGLIDDEVLVEYGPVEQGMVGKPARPLWFAEGAGSVVAVDVRAEGIRAALVDARGQVIDELYKHLTNPGSSAEVNRVVRTLALQLREGRTPLGIGISVPGTVDPSTGEVVGSHQVPGAVGHSLVDMVSAATGLPTFAENDSRAQALAEQWFGLGRGVDTFTSVQTGEGLSVGLVFEGSMLRGPNGTAGELGHHAVVVDGRLCRCGLRGCWETIATLSWLRDEAKDAGLAKARTIDSRRLTQMAADGSPEAAALLERYAEHLSIGLANIRQILGSRFFILHGDAVTGGEVFRRKVEDAANRRALGPVQVVHSQLDDRATLLGAVAIVLTELLHLSS